jgi:dihydrofolate reductase
LSFAGGERINASVNTAMWTNRARVETAGDAAALEFVVAVSENDVIGRANALPWHLPADLGRFKQITLGNAVLMGRKTHESIGKALPGRLNLVLTHSANRLADGVTAVASVHDARKLSGRGSVLMVIGGGEVFRECLPLAVRIHLTIVHTRIDDGDVTFDAWRGHEWRESARTRHEADEKNAYAYSFVTLERDSAIGVR